MVKYAPGDIWDFGTRVKIVAGTQFAYLNKYPASIVSFRWREDGGIDYRIRAWRTNQTWIPAEQLEKLSDANFCSGCMKLLDQPVHAACHCGCCP